MMREPVSQPPPRLVAWIATDLSAEFARALGLKPNGVAHRLTAPLMLPPVRRVATLLASTDAIVAEHGFSCGISWLADQFAPPSEVTGDAFLLGQGPLLVVANHPGAYDSILLMSALQRDDLLSVTSDIPALTHLRHVQPNLYVVRRGQGDAPRLRDRACEHLSNGGSLLIFPSGRIDPDPCVDTGAEAALASWSSSIGLIVQSAPATRIVVAGIGNVISRRWLRSRIARLWPDGHERRRLAEFLQISQSVFLRRRAPQPARISFSQPVTIDDVPGERSPAAIRDYLAERARIQLTALTTERG